MEMAADGGGRRPAIGDLSLVIRNCAVNCAARPWRKSVTAPTFTVDGLAARQSKSIVWLLGASAAPDTDPEPITESEAIDILSTSCA